MRTLHRSALGAPVARRGVALLLALLLLVVLIAITIQIGVTTGTDARIARNDQTMSLMDLSVESALLQVGETLKTDGESTGEGAGAAPGAGAAGAPAGGAPAAGAGAPPGGGESESSDSQRDEWHEPQRTTINDIQLRIFVQDEDSKYNVLNMLAPDEKEAEAAFERVKRIFDFCREGSREFDIDPRMAEDMAKVMLEHMQRRADSKIPRPALLTDVEDADEGLPLSIEEFAALAPFEEHHFRDLRDRDGQVVHSIASFLTVWTSVGVAADLPQTGKSGTSAAGSAGKPSTGGSSNSKSGSGNSDSTGKAGSTSQNTGANGTQGGDTAGANGQAGGAGNAAGTGAPGATGGAGGATTTGGYAVNVNTAPAAVLKALFDDREVNPRFFDKVLEYRNLEEEEKEGEEEEEETDVNAKEEPELDEYGQEKIERRIFDSIGELAEVEGYKDLPAEVQGRLNQILTTKSNVFTVFVVARKTTSAQGDMDATLTPQELRKKEEQSGDSLVRVVRSVVWRHTVDEEVLLTPIVRWEIVDYLPYDVLDFPPEDR